MPQSSLGRQSSKPLFRFHKNLATSRYDEFLADSDDEDFFRSKPRTKDGRNYALDFKIDTYRDEITVNRHGSQKKLIAGRDSLADRVLTGDSQALYTYGTTESTQQLPPFDEQEQDDDLADPISGLELFAQVENLLQIPLHEEMGETNKTILRCTEATFKINVAEMNELGVATTKQMKAANQAMIQRSSLPVFSGNVNCYLVNQLLEFDLIAKVKNVMSREDTNRVALSSVHPYY